MVKNDGYLLYYDDKVFVNTKPTKSIITKEDELLIKGLYIAGLSCRAIGDKFEIGYRTINRKLEELGVLRRKPGGSIKGRNKK
jgi:transposase